MYFVANIQNEPKTNPNEPNFLEDKHDSKPKNGDFDIFYENLFMQNEPNGMLIGIKIAMEYELSENTKNTKQSQFGN